MQTEFFSFPDVVQSSKYVLEDFFRFGFELFHFI